MLDVHPPHTPTHSWRDFFLHIATIVIGLLIAVALEQTVEYVHHHHQAAEARANIQDELANNVKILHFNLQHLDQGKQQLESSLDALNSRAADAEVLTHLQYTWNLAKERDAAWEAAKIDGSLALIPPAELSRSSYLYNSGHDLTPNVFAYFTDIDTAAAIVGHARASGTLTASERQQLLVRTMSALGNGRLLSTLYNIRVSTAEHVRLQ